MVMKPFPDSACRELRVPTPREAAGHLGGSWYSQASDHVPTLLPSQITIERDSNEDVSDPKHGKEDPDNMPHVGGNTWAGGTGW